MTWLLDHLIKAGHVTEAGITRRARVRPCHRGCKSYVLVGLDGIICAIEASCDPQPLNALGEAVAILEGRYTDALHREGGHYVLDPRMPANITARPAGTASREDVLREHRCGSPPIPAALTAPTAFVSPPPTAVTEDPPF